MNSFKLMLSFFTRIPVGNISFDNGEFEKGIKYTAIIGFVIGIILTLVASVMSNFIKGDVLGFILVGVYLFITGGLHLDGVSDTCDGIFSNRSSERMLEIMKDSRVGSFGVISLIILLYGYFVFLGKSPLLVILLFPIVGKTSIILACKISHYCRESGMGKSFIENGGNKGNLGLTMTVNVLMISGVLIYGNAVIVLAIVLTYLLSLLIVRNISKKLNGITGDVLGFIVEISQLIFLILAYIGGSIL